MIFRGDPPFGGDMTPVTPQPDTASTSNARTKTPAIAESHLAKVTHSIAITDASEDYRDLDLGDGVTMRLVKIPASRGPAELSVDYAFWMGTCEVTNRQYAQFDPHHDSRFEHRGSWIFSEEYLGWPLDTPNQPVVRVSWDEAAAFCRALSARTGRRFRLPTEQEWEYACRAGSETAFWYGDESTDYSRFANLGDRSLRRLAYESWTPKPPDLVARDDRFDDGHLVTADAGTYAANPFGLHDMHGNVAEWTSGLYSQSPQRRAVRGGSCAISPAKLPHPNGTVIALISRCSTWASAWCARSPISGEKNSRSRLTVPRLLVSVSGFSPCACLLACVALRLVSVRSAWASERQ